MFSFFSNLHVALCNHIRLLRWNCIWHIPPSPVYLIKYFSPRFIYEIYHRLHCTLNLIYLKLCPCTFLCAKGIFKIYQVVFFLNGIFKISERTSTCQKLKYHCLGIMENLKDMSCILRIKGLFVNAMHSSKEQNEYM